jgi:hypothetical protein
LAEIRAAKALAKLGKESRLLTNNTCDCKFARSYWLPCRYIIYAYEFLGQIDEPNWSEFAELFDESRFEVYFTRGLVEDNEEDENQLSPDIEAKLLLSETLDQIRNRFYEVSKYSNSLDSDEKARLLIRWQNELTSFSSTFIGQSLQEWINRDDEVVLF